MLTGKQVYDGDADVAKTLPAVFLKVLPIKVTQMNELCNSKIEVQASCVSGTSYTEDLKFADEVIPLLASITVDDRTLTAETIVSMYEDKILTVKAEYQLTTSEDQKDEELMGNIHWNLKE